MERRAAALTRWMEEHASEALAFLETLVNQDSGSYDRAGVNRVGDLLAEALVELGFAVSRVPQTEHGDHLVARRPGAPGGRSLLCIGHMDTVYPAGTAAARPFRVEGPRATGPGVLDMKGGLVVLITALRALRAADSPAFCDLGITVLVNTDEEIGSPTSRELFLDLARRHPAAIVLEPARPSGECVIGRKGVGHFRLEVFGRQAHAGSQPEFGANAIWELARKVCAVQELGDAERGTTVHVGVIRGGERTNVIPDYAVADIDLRIWSDEEGKRIAAGIRAVAGESRVPGTSGRCEGEISFPPWPTNEGTRRMLEILREAGKPLGLNVEGITTGGGSDGNRTAALIPTLDGLGVVGSRLHSPEEFIEVRSLQERAALLAMFFEVYRERFAA
ncbi:MAG: M20 family metallopeptidase [Candidatus Methylomirabilota bacterium]